MKHLNLLLLPMLIGLTSCVSLSQGQPGGSIFDPEDITSELEADLPMYPDGVFGDSVPSEKQDSFKLIFRNNEERANIKYESNDQLLGDVSGDKDAILNFEFINAWKAIYGLKLDYRPNVDNKLTINLKEGYARRYLKITCTSAYYNEFDHANNDYKFISGEGAIKVDNKSYVKLPPEQDLETKKAKTYDVTFDLTSEASSFTLACTNYSVAIYEIELFN